MSRILVSGQEAGRVLAGRPIVSHRTSSARRLSAASPSFRGDRCWARRNGVLGGCWPETSVALHVVVIVSPCPSQTG